MWSIHIQWRPVVTRTSGGIFWDRLIGGALYGISPVDLDIVIPSQGYQPPGTQRPKAWNWTDQWRVQFHRVVIL